MNYGKILVLGARGMLGQQMLAVFGDGAVGWDRGDCDVADFVNLKSKITNLKSLQAVINCVAYNDVDGAEDHRDLAKKLNVEEPANLAKICRELDIPLVHFSTNYVFDGAAGEYREVDEPRPLSVYAETKYRGEQAVMGNCRKYYLIRTAVLFGPKGASELSKTSFIDKILAAAAAKPAVQAVSDQINSVTYAVDLARQVKVLLDENAEFGIYHITNSGAASWYGLAQEAFAVKGIKTELQPVSSSAFPRKARLPSKAVLLNTKLPPLRSWQDALKDFLSQN